MHRGGLHDLEDTFQEQINERVGFMETGEDFKRGREMVCFFQLRELARRLF